MTLSRPPETPGYDATPDFFDSPPPQPDTLADAHVTCNVLFCMSNMHIYKPGKSSVVFLDCPEKGTRREGHHGGLLTAERRGESVAPRQNSEGALVALPG